MRYTVLSILQIHIHRSYIQVSLVLDSLMPFSPCIDLNVLRWQRASDFGLDPPPGVLELLNRLAPDSPLQNNIWHKRI